MSARDDGERSLGCFTLLCLALILLFTVSIPIGRLAHAVERLADATQAAQVAK